MQLKQTVIKLCLYFTLLMSPIVTHQAIGETLRDVKIGVLAFRGTDACLKRWGPTAEYLTKNIPGYRFLVIPMTHSELASAIQDNMVDFILTNTGHYIQLEAKYGISRMATLRTPGNWTSGNVFGAVVFVRADRTDIQTLSDLKGKRFMAVGKFGFGGFQMTWRRLKAQGIDPFTDFSKILFSGFPQDRIAYAVRDGDVDAGTFRTGSLEALAFEGKIKLTDFRILEPKNFPDFPYPTSTRLYPEWPFAKHRLVPDRFAQSVAITLLKMPGTSDAARVGRYAGWTVPLDYQPVHELFRELQIEPYSKTNKITFALVFQRYRMWITVFTTALILSLIWSVWARKLVARRTNELRLLNEDLVNQMAARRLLEEQVIMRQNELTYVARQNSLGELTSSLAHELNQPLTTILNYVKGCLRRINLGKCDNKDILNVLQQISNQAQHSANVIRVMRDFVSSQPREREYVNLNSLVGDIADLVRLEVENRSITLEIDTVPMKMIVFVDQVQIEQVLLNLVRNAIEAIPADRNIPGRIIVRTDLADSSHVCVHVIDNGGGIPPEIRDELFEPFKSRKPHGLGLGLSISQSILESHMSKLQIVTTSRKGSELSFCLSLAQK